MKFKNIILYISIGFVLQFFFWQFTIMFCLLTEGSVRIYENNPFIVIFLDFPTIFFGLMCFIYTLVRFLRIEFNKRLEEELKNERL